MVLYHGSNLTIQNPKIIISKRRLDFGAGFYLTSDLNQAIRWAKRKVQTTLSGQATVSFFELNNSYKRELKILHFRKANKDWLHFIVNCRYGNNKNDLNYDLIIGPVANDTTFRVVNNYVANNIDERVALILLKPQKLKDQFTFKNENALSYLNFIGASIYE